MPAQRPTRDEYVHWERVTTRWADIDVYGHEQRPLLEIIDTVVNNPPHRGDRRGHPVAGRDRGGGRGGLPLPPRSADPVDVGLVAERVGTSSVVYRGPVPGCGEEAAAEGRFGVYADDTDPARPVTLLPDAIRAAVSPLLVLRDRHRVRGTVEGRTRLGGANLIVLTMIVVPAVAGLVVVYVAYPTAGGHAGRALARGMTRATEAAPVLEVE